MNFALLFFLLERFLDPAVVVVVVAVVVDVDVVISLALNKFLNES
jgi:hypothetical protein